MCGHCKENHSPSPYSYQLKCAHWSHYKYNWLRYLVVFFQFSALSVSMNAFIFILQIVSSPSVMILMSTFANFGKAVGHKNVIIVLKILATAFGIWNLDFFRRLYKLLPSSKPIHNSGNVPRLCCSYVSTTHDCFNIHVL